MRRRPPRPRYEACGRNALQLAAALGDKWHRHAAEGRDLGSLTYGDLGPPVAHPDLSWPLARRKYGHR
jgi:hypothetical protein